jgi:hypothetical protein
VAVWIRGPGGNRALLAWWSVWPISGRGMKNADFRPVPQKTNFRPVTMAYVFPPPLRFFELKPPLRFFELNPRCAFLNRRNKFSDHVKINVAN